MISEQEKKNIKDLYKAFIALETEEECEAFLDDVCTIKEIRDMAARLKVARMLDEKKVFSEITQQTGCSSATISRVNKCLQFGDGGYSTVIERLKEK
ncbi:MAG: hypothetical protein GX852_00655 [Clostridiales bacterium]|jgi:TrpR-related protein YerC/YecD|nr:hypothetical protein [Clostridiales bacterium]